MTRSAYDAIVAHTRDARPYEACGILGGAGGVISDVFSAENASPSKAISYEIGPKDLLTIFRELDDRDVEHLGIYHSHPFTRAYPSDTDIRLATYDVPYVIVSLRDERAPYVKAFSIREGAVAEEPIELV